MQVGQAKGKRTNVFAKVGDSITESMAFLNDYCCGWYDLGPHKELEEVIKYFAAVHIDELPAQVNPYHTSFDRMSLVAESGAYSYSMLEGGAKPRLMQEIDAIKPGLAIVMFGTNDALAGEDVATYKANMKQMVTILKGEGVIPILSTIPDLMPPAQGGERVPAFNKTIRELALEEQVPLMDFWQALQPLPNKGLDADGIHPNVFMEGDEYRSGYLTPQGLQYGFNVRNKLALEMLLKLKRIVIDNGPPDAGGPVAAVTPSQPPVVPSQPPLVATKPPVVPTQPLPAPGAGNPNPPAETVKLIFIHHSTGGNWLADPNTDVPYGGLGQALMNSNYFVSATNYGWGPNQIGDRTDIVNWPEWFTGPNSHTYTNALYNESGQNIGDFGAWSRLASDPGGENEIVMLKSCFPNSDLYGNPDDPPLPEPNDYEYTVANAKAVYNNILTYFATRQDKLFVVVTAPPLMQSETAPERAANARAFNNWLVKDWLTGYAHKNVVVFDFYNVLTSNGGNVNTNDADSASGNHHRWRNGTVEHIQTVNNNYSAYPSDDSHPTTAGHQKATSEFVPLLNIAVHCWRGDGGCPPLMGR
jgi:hypothetical protein